eukprot:jgi/Pico_ML_1/54346/g4708.t1
MASTSLFVLHAFPLAFPGRSDPWMTPSLVSRVPSPGFSFGSTTSGSTIVSTASSSSSSLISAAILSHFA